ncbi:MAG: serine/threonine-protein kinase [Gemmataceae bacterium]
MDSTSTRQSQPTPAAPPDGSGVLRLRVDDDGFSLDSAEQISDERPTIISKGHPVAEAIKPGQPREHLANSLRGRRLAHFELIEPIGVGGMAAVIRARDTQLDRFVALKILPPEMAADEENIRRFHQEARAAAKLDHENIARVFFCGEDQRLHFIAFEFVEGDNLRTILDRRGRLSVPEAVRYVLQIATGLEHAASRGVVHRDIKPSNIIITPSGKAKLVDMGLARSQEPQSDQLTQSGVTLGTFDYISPEQALEPRDADSRSDLYSLGCTFYHMLTGKAPVPEGTAAKKLHHHQHVPPIDPRHLNPDIPDEVALIIGKMMAKDPRDRYQRPIYLVQHLMQIAQKVGAAADLPEGGLIVETPLPGTPRKRPLLIIGLAAAALAAQIMLLSFLGGEHAPGPVGGPPAKERTAVVKEKENGKPSLARPPKELGSFVVASGEELAKALASPEAMLVRLERDPVIDLGEGLHYAGGKRALVIESKDPAEPATLRFKPGSLAGAAHPYLAGFFAEGGTLTFRNVNFEIEASSTPEFPLAALAVGSGAKVRCERCKFFQKEAPQTALLRPEASKSKLPIASVLAENPGEGRPAPVIVLEQCFFSGMGKFSAEIGGQAAIALNGSADVTVSDGAFFPHESLFHLRGVRKEISASLRLNRCSAFVYNGPVFRVDEEARTAIQVQNSIFSSKDWTIRVDPPHLIYQRDSREPLIRFEGRHNYYHNLASLWTTPVDGSPSLVNSLEDLKKVVAGKGDDESTYHAKDAAPIWQAENPVSELPQQAFLLRSDAAAARTLDLKQTLGVHECYWGEVKQPAFVRKDSPEAGPRLAANQKLVDPDAGETPGKQVFKDLNQALAHARSGDVILIKQPRSKRQLEISPSPLDKSVVDLTFKPYEGSRPVLAMADTLDADAAFFRLQEGKLHFEDLDFILEPDQPGFTAQSLVMLAGNVSCTFKGCSITMRPPDRAKGGRAVPVSVVSLLEPGKAMAMPSRSPRGTPEIVMTDCVVRGDGCVMNVRSSRPFDLRLENSLFCVTGGLLQIAGSSKEVAGDLGATLRMERVSGFSGEAMIALRGGEMMKAYVPLTVESARNSLFVALGAQPLAHLESPATTEDAVRLVLNWKGEAIAPNAYSMGPTHLYLENVRREDSLVTLRLDKQGWKDFSGETDARFPEMAFPLPASARSAPWLVQPDDLTPRGKLAEQIMSKVGAEVDPALAARLPDFKKTDTPPTAP